MKTVYAAFVIIVLLMTGCSSSHKTEQAGTTSTANDQTPPPPKEEPTVTYPGEATTASAVTTGSGLKIIDMVVGTGASPVQGDRVTVHYTGYLLNGKKFDSSVDRGAPFTFDLGKGAVIKGWDEGVATMKIGGKRKLIIPSYLGYGSRGAGGGLIPPEAELIFDVELLGINN